MLHLIPIPCMSMEKELALLAESLPILNALYHANQEAGGPHSSGCVFWEEQFRVATLRIQQIQELLTLEMPHTYYFSCHLAGAMHWVQIVIDGWPTRSKALAECNPKYFYYPDNWDLANFNQITPLWQKHEPEEYEFFHQNRFGK